MNRNKAEGIERLFHEHNIRLLGVDCGLNFLLDAPTEQWVSVVEHQLEVQALLEELLPDDVRQRVVDTPDSV
nr:hypothetical protein BaRGS_005940 [Batillaria attramentaria]